MTTPLGQIAYLQSVQANVHIYAVVTDGSTPNLNTISLELNADEATAAVPALIGAQGPPGAPQFALNVQMDVFSSPSALPAVAEQTIGDYWLIEQTDDNGNIVSSAAYVAWGSFYRVLPFGTQGPTGPVPVVTPDVILIDADAKSYVLNTGTVANPSWTFYLAVPVGPQGPQASLAACPDVNESTQPTPGQVLGFNGAYSDGLPVWQPMTVGALAPLPYTVPESAFTSFNGIATANQTVATFAVPPNPFAWKPMVFGQVEVFGIELSANPLLIGVEVMLGDPTTGTLVGRGYGNGLGGVVTIVPQASSSNSANTAMTPTNSTALVPKNHTGTQGTLYVNLVNDGIAAVYDYNATNSQLFVMAVPATTEGAVNATVYGSLSQKITFEAWTVTLG